MREQAIKQALARHIAARRQDLPLLLEEVDIQGGQSRADLVDVEHLHCYEIKSDGDSLSRLLSQGARYAMTFNRVTLVSAARHLEKALDIVPDWWGVMIIPETERGDFRAIRRAQVNRDQEPTMLASVLTRDECLDLLDRRDDLKGWKSKSLYLVQAHIANALSLKELKGELKHYLGLRNPMAVEPNSAP